MPAGEGLAIVALAAHAGLRDSCHIDSLYRTTTDDILYGRHFDDVIARGSYRVDIHEGAGITFKYLDGHFERTYSDEKGHHYETGRWREDDGKMPTWYEIPYRSIVPKGAENVLAPGRILDCERDAYGACRVMVNCNQMGEAAGRAAANLISPFDNTLQTIAFGYIACAIVYRIPSRAVRFAIPAALLFAVLKTRSDAKQKGMCL